MNSIRCRNILSKVLLLCLLGILLLFCFIGIWAIQARNSSSGKVTVGQVPKNPNRTGFNLRHDTVVHPMLKNMHGGMGDVESTTPPDIVPDYQILLNGKAGGSSGAVYVKTDGEVNFLCRDNFTEADAAVVCREVGYSQAIIYNFMSPFQYTRYLTTRPVLKDLNCTGNEDAIHECAGFYVRNVTSCTWFATVVCYDDEPYNLRLVNGKHPDSGLVEIQVGGVWGTFCAIRNFDDELADILCRSMNYTGGVTLQRGVLGEVNLSKVWVPYILCQEGGDIKHSIFECMLILHPENIPKDLIDFRNNRYNHEYLACTDNPSSAAAVQCFKNEFQGRR